MLDWVLDRQARDAARRGRHAGADGRALHRRFPRASSRCRTPASIQGISEAPQTISFAAMAERQQALAAGRSCEDPAVESLSSFIGVDGTNTTLNSGRMLINLKPLRAARRAAPPRSSGACSRKLAQVDGITLYMQPVQDLTIEDRVSRTQYQFTLEDADPDELRRLGAAAGRAAAHAAASSPTSPATCRTRACRRTSRSTATPRRASASRRRRSTTRSTTRSASGWSRPSSRSRTSTAWCSR